MVAALPRRRMLRWMPAKPGGLLNVGTSRSRSLAARPSERAASAKRIVSGGGVVIFNPIGNSLPSTAILPKGCDNGRVDDDARPTAHLNPAQQAVIDELGAPATERPEFPDDLRHHLRAAIETAVEPYLDALPASDDLFVSKHRLGRVHGCEARFVAEEAEDFAWSVPIARGTITHKAVELAINWRREIEPPVLVDEALARCEEDSGDFGRWLRGCTEVERAELRSDSLDAFTKFVECFPPLKPSWRPVTESRLRAELCDGRLVLAGKSDLTLGAADGLRAGKVIIDFKTGGFAPVHLDDLRFYALIETLRMGVPPRLLASYYLDQAHLVPEAVTEDLLRATVARLVDGVRILMELLHGGRPPGRLPSPACRWCPLLDDCDDGLAHLADDDL